jgi:hypothetical protein
MQQGGIRTRKNHVPSMRSGLISPDSSIYRLEIKLAKKTRMTGLPVFGKMDLDGNHIKAVRP